MKGTPKTTIYQKFKRASQFETGGDPELEKLLEASATFAASVNFTNPYWLTLCGRSGIGKSHLARKIWEQFIDCNRHYGRIERKENSGQFCDWRKFCADVRAGAYDLIDDLCAEHFLVIDDIGTEYDPNGFIASALDRILNSRRGKWTLITVNLFLADIASKIDTRVASRMLRDGNVVVESNAQDYNLKG